MTRPPGEPWADPATETQPGPPAPYASPPYAAQPYGPPQQPYGQAPWGPPPWGGWPAYGPPQWGWAPPARPRKPGQVIAAAVLAFVQAALVLFGSMYVYMISSLVGLAAGQADPDLDLSRAEDLASEGQLVALLQLLSVIALVVGGILVLSRASRTSWLLLLGCFVVQLLLASYWAVRLADLVLAVAATGGGRGALVGLALFFAAAPLVGFGLLVAGPGRRWFTEPRA